MTLKLRVICNVNKKREAGARVIHNNHEDIISPGIVSAFVKKTHSWNGTFLEKLKLEKYVSSA